MTTTRGVVVAMLCGLLAGSALAGEAEAPRATVAQLERQVTAVRLRIRGESEHQQQLQEQLAAVTEPALRQVIQQEADQSARQLRLLFVNLRRLHGQIEAASRRPTGDRPGGPR